ncbi:unnamed protein product [Clonostachys rosea]|uniref:DUF6546 domain-containing protein n=1 Tax=Bionectria ochroleuca TaxID=29856 RepID=A0ABY6U4X2_BIOOC|nr:unnamed protein product [Clonostachys rosea]
MGQSQRRRSWDNLPSEMRWKILKVLCQDSGIAKYASVCSEWQGFIERITFQHLILNNSTIKTFDRMISGDKNVHRVHYIQYIWLRIAISDFGCLQCIKRETELEAHSNDLIFTQVVHKLLDILSTWPRRVGSDGVTLEISVICPSDNEHFYYDFATHDDYPFKPWDLNIVPHDVDMFHEAHFRKIDRTRLDCPPHWHTWMGGMENSEYFQVEERHLGSLIQFRWPNGTQRLPRVEVVNSLVMRHQFKRQLSPLALATLFSESLVYATSLRLERWCRPTTEEENDYLTEFRQHSLPSLPKSLQSFHYVAETFRGGRLVNPVQVNSLSTVQLLANYGHRWKELSVVAPFGSLDQFTESHSLKALDTEPLSPKPWLRLQRVCFKSTVLIPGNEALISDLLISTATIARNMPNLRSIEVFNTKSEWGGSEHPSCLVRYNTEFPQPILSWQSDWMIPTVAIYEEISEQTPGFSFTAQTKRAWGKTALVHTGHDGLKTVVREPRTFLSPRVRLADIFKLEAVHPLTRAIMRAYSDRTKL